MCSGAGSGALPPLGCPIRRSAGRRVCAPHRGLSQLATSFFGFLCQGIHRAPLVSSRLDCPSKVNRLSQGVIGYVFSSLITHTVDDFVMKMFIRDRSKNQISLTTLCGCQGAPRVSSGALGAGRCPYAWGRCADCARIRCLPRKEVIQPHLPVRLPCYDFTPLTPRTFGDSPHCWLGRRLRVQTTRVV